MEKSSCPEVRAINLTEISHHDLAWVEGCFEAEVDFVNREISVALDAIAGNDETAWSHELAAFVHQFLKAHPERREELHRRLTEGRFEIGAGYSSPYTSAVTAETLVRQFIYGKKWVDDTFPGYHANVFYNTDIPGMTPQFPQILAKSGVDYLYASRSWNFPGYDHTEMKLWKAPDGTPVKTLFLNHYGNAWGRCGGDINSDAYLEREVKNFIKHRQRENLGDEMPLVYSSDSIKSIDFTQRIESWNEHARKNGLPPMTYSTVQKALDRVFAADADFSRDTLAGEWPNTWFYESNPADYEAYLQHKNAERLLRGAETLGVIRAVFSGKFENYPAEDIREAWLALEMVCHGYAPKGAIEDFEASYRKGYALASRLYEEQLNWLLARIGTGSQGTPVVVFNTLSWKRTELVTLDAPEAPVSVFSASGKELPSQITADGKLLFAAEELPSMGYTVFYLKPGKAQEIQENTPWNTPFENDFYRVIPGKDGTLAGVTDLETGKELFDCHKFGVGQILKFQYDGMGAGEHLNIWQPHDPEAAREVTGWTCTENGPVRTRFEAQVAQGAGTAVVQVSLYRNLKRLDFDVTLKGFGETPKNQIRMMFPVAMDSMFGPDDLADNRNTRVSYEVPFGVSVVGDEVLPRFSRFNDNTWDPNNVGGDNANPLDFDKISAVRPRNVQNWIRAENKDFFVNISSLNLGWDYQDATPDPVRSPVLQPVLLSISKSCHGGFGYWEQPGDHHYHFTLTSGPADQAKAADRAAISVNNLPDARIQTENVPVMPESWSAFGADSDHIMITAVKQAEDHPGQVVVRWYETQGRPEKSTILRLPAAVRSAEETNLIEHPIAGSCEIQGSTLHTETRPWSIRTVLVKLK